MSQLSYDDALQLYRNCVVETQGKLGFVMDVNPGEEDQAPQLTIAFVGERAHRTIDADPDLVLCPSEPYRLGYIQVGSRAYYLSRQPRRQYQVGWSEGNVSGWRFGEFKRMGVRFRDNLLGMYMPYSEALEQSREDGGTYAFDRMFAVSHEGQHLCYKGQSIAAITDGVPTLEVHNCTFLKPLLDVAMMER